MKTAKIPNGDLMVASATSPKEAICPHCGGIVILRSRRRMNDDKVSYFWRHRNNKNPNCSGRRRPV